MTKRMLIDAAHPDETRVVLLDHDTVYDYDFVTSSKSQIKGNIYLAKITRVEPSLQAAFVEYGGGKQGFLPFSEIHPDYYQLPQEDKQKLLEEQIAEAEAEEAAEEAAFEREQAVRDARARGEHVEGGETDEDEFGNEDELLRSEPEAASESESVIAYTDASMADSAVVASLPSIPPLEIAEPFAPELDVAPMPTSRPLDAASFATHSDPLPEEALAGDDVFSGDDHSHSHEDGPSSEIAGEEHEEESRGGRRNARSMQRRYRIQEVVKRNQIVLVQVIKEERGNKGASLTTFISLAGRAAVLMPNSPKGGGISRKITDRETRKRLKEVAAEMRTHRGMSVIIRTAGIDRTKAEIRRDFEYLVSLWNEVRDLTLASSAPALIYEEGNLVKRSLRDLYTSDVEEVIVEGDDAYREAKSFMKMLTPGHIGRIKQYTGTMPLFAYAGVEDQLAAMVEPQVRLPSGGYLVIHPTEALISIDVNSGRSTTERNVEETAIKTNLEAAYEVARQLRLRDLAGLIVVDFIDMGFSKNRKQVERAMKDALKADRAKIQIGRISMFGLMELSRQRLRPSISEAMGVMCPHCKGTGYISSVETVGIQIIRALEKEASTGEFATLRLTTHPEAALYLLNEKRAALQSLEQRYHVSVVVLMDSAFITGNFRLVKVTSDGRELLHEPSSSNNNNNARSSRRGRRSRRGGREGQGDGRAVSFETTAASDATEEELAYEALEDDDEILIRAEGSEEPRRERGERSERGERGERGEQRRRSRGGRNRNRNGRNRDRDENTLDATTVEGVEPAAMLDAEGNEGFAVESELNADGTPRERNNRRRGRRGGRNRNRRDRGPREERTGDASYVAEAGSEHETAAASSHEAPAPQTERAAYTPVPTPTYTTVSATPDPRPTMVESPKPSFVIPLSEAQTNPAAVASPIRSESTGTADDSEKSKRKGWWSRVLEN